MAHIPLANAADSWSPRWRSLHPMFTDYEILDALKTELERRFAARGGPHAIARLEINRQTSACFRLPNGDLVQWAQSTKAASTSIMAAICRHMPHLWRGARKSWGLPDGQPAAPAQDIFDDAPLFPARVMLPHASRRRAHAPASIAADWQIIRCNPERPEQTPPGIWMIPWSKFRPQSHTRIRFCVVREPVERFVSAIAFLFHHGGSNHASAGTNLQDYLEKTLKMMDDTGRPHDEHLARQVFFIGRDPAYYTHIFRMGDWKRLEACLSEWLGKSVQLPHENPGRGKETIALTPALRQRVKAFYAKDYQFWGRYF